MDIAKINREALKKYKEKFWARYQERCKDQAGHRASILEENQESQTDPDQYIRDQLPLPEYGLVCLYGLGDGRLVRRLARELDGSQILLVYEPELARFREAMDRFPLDDLCSREDLILIVEGINEDKLPDKLNEHITYQNTSLVRLLVLPEYESLCPGQRQKLEELIAYYSELERLTRNTEIKYAEKMGNNILHNLVYMVKESSIGRLKESFAKEDLTDLPAIIIGAGPSLDKNIRDLKKAVGKAFLIGVDSALGALVRHGIPIQLAVSVDPRKNPAVFSDPRVQKLNYVLSGYVIPAVASQCQGRLFFEEGYGTDIFSEIIEQKTGKKMDSLRTGGSVSTDAFSLAVALGFQNIILVGQDMAFTDGKGHYADCQASYKSDKDHVASRSDRTIEGYDGRPVVTDSQMDSYRQWFEMEIALGRKSGLKVYNCTEGGAKIQGAIQLPLAEALDLFPKEMDFDRIVADVPPNFSLEEKENLCREFLQTRPRISELEADLKEGIKAYRRLLKLEQSPGKNAEEYRSLVDQITKVNHIEDENKYMELIKLYAKQDEYEASEDIYTAEDLSVADIAKRGERMLEGYVNGCKKCGESVETILEPLLKEEENAIKWAKKRQNTAGQIHKIRRVLFYQWHSFMNRGLEEGLKELGIAYDAFFYQQKDWERNEGLQEEAVRRLSRTDYDAVLSVNYSPLLSEVCEDRQVPYVAWVYDNPIHIRDTHTLGNECNRLFFFDRVQAAGYQKKGIHAWHMPLAGDLAFYKSGEAYRTDISMVGKLYQTDYAYYQSPLTDLQRGYLDGILQAQMKVYGGYFLGDLLTDQLLEDLNQSYARASDGKASITRAELEYMMACEITGRERYLALALLSGHFRTDLYSDDHDKKLDKVRYHGYADYYKQMSAIFRTSKVNLNISLKIIQSGVPLRVFDILASGGFLLTNFQAEMYDLFQPGEDFVIYESLEDLYQKAAYYLDNDRERERIAEHGHKTLKDNYTFPKQLGKIISQVEASI